jgi:hypothetical protein
MRIGHSVPISLAASALVVAGAFTVGAAAQSPAMADPLPALLAEVRALRIAMEQQAAIGPRVQLTLARLNIEEARVSHLTGDLTAIRQQLAATEIAVAQVAEESADIEQRLQREADPVKRAQLETAQRDLQLRQRQHDAEERRLRARENDAAQAVAAEQARWVELNSRLDDLERQLAPVR